MTSILAIYPGPGWIVMCVAMLCVLMAQFALLMASRRAKWERRLPLAVHCAVNFALTVLLMMVFYRTYREEVRAKIALLDSIPWAAVAAAVFLSAALLVLEFQRYLAFRGREPDPDDIRETVDGLPVGICVADPDGGVRLRNLTMNRLSAALTGRLLDDAASFWQAAEQAGEPQGGQVLVRLRGEECWLFTKRRMTVDGEERDLLTAQDMTGPNRITEELRAKNRQLKDVQARLKAVAVRERELVIAREIVNARRTVHNQMGNVLLIGRYAMEHPESTDQTELLRLLEYNTHFLLGEAEQPDDLPESFERALRNAARIGVTVRTEGEIPPAGQVRDLLAQAVEQCAANAARHAGGDMLTLRVSEECGKLKAEITNNGKPPEGEIRETGGLAALRRMAEDAGAGMNVESEPVFRLTLRI